jgi:hypothetical protein
VSKRTGMGISCYIDGYTLGNDIGAIDEIGGGTDTLDVTGLDKSAYERIGGIRDGRMAFTAYFNPAANKAHARLKTLATTDSIVTLALTSAVGSVGAPSVSLVAKQINYDGSRADDGSFTFKVEAQSNGYGVGWGETLTPGISFLSGAASTSSLDYGASELRVAGLAALLRLHRHERDRRHPALDGQRRGRRVGRRHLWRVHHAFGDHR